MEAFRFHVHLTLLSGKCGATSFHIEDGVIYVDAKASVVVPDRIKYGSYDMPVVKNISEADIVPL